MKQIVYIVILIIVIIGVYIYNTNQIQELQDTLTQKNSEIENLNNEITNTQPTEKSKEPIVIEMSSDAVSSLSAECMNTNYIENEAIYIFDSLVEEINIDPINNIKTINLKILNWLKGDKNTNNFQIITGIAENGESAKIEQDKYYRIFLQKVPNSDKLIFVCAFKGVRELGLI